MSLCGKLALGFTPILKISDYNMFGYQVWSLHPNLSFDSNTAELGFRVSILTGSCTVTQFSCPSLLSFVCVRWTELQFQVRSVSLSLALGSVLSFVMI